MDGLKKQKKNVNLDNKDENFVISPSGIEIVLSLI